MRNAPTMLAAISLALSVPAGAVPPTPEPELRFWEGKLLESAEGDLRAAVQVYLELADELDSADHAVMRVRALLAAGNALHLMGELEHARRAFDSCRRISTSGFANVDTDSCAAGARQVALDQGALRSIPARLDFSDTDHGFVLFSRRGSMAVEPRAEGHALVWSQEVAGPQIADLVLAIEAPERAPQGARLKLQIDGDNALLEFIVEDDRGYAYTLSGKLFRVDRELRQWEVDFAELEPVDPGWPELDPSRISALRLRDSTGFQLPELRSRHRIILQEFSVF